MASKSTQVRAKGSKGDELHLSHSQTDSPILDINSLERLQQFRPDIVNFVIEQTQAESEYRRAESKRVNTFTFIERMGGILVSILICLFGIFGSIYALNNGSEKLAITIAAISIGTLAVAYLGKKKG